jgi:excisionase family DNA binding protein
MNRYDDLSNDLLDGASAIGNFLNLTNRQVFHAVERGRLPVVRLGTKILARRSTLLKWFEAQEQMAFAAMQEAA